MGLLLRVVKKNNEDIGEYNELNECNQFLSGINGRRTSYNFGYYFDFNSDFTKAVVRYET